MGPYPAFYALRVQVRHGHHECALYRQQDSTEGESAVKDISRSSSGGSINPIDLLKIAGVDLTKKDVFAGAMKVFEETLEEFLAL